MDLLQSILLGFQNSLQPINLFYCFVGVLVGTMIGVLPGIGPVGTMAILMPVTFHAPPLASIILLAGIYYGAMYGGSTTSILVNIPGEAASVMTCLDGYEMARQGRAGPALGIAAFGSFIAGTLGLIGLMLVAKPIARFAIKFGPPEFFSLMILGLLMLIYITQKSLKKSMMMAAFGFLISFVGMDIITGYHRFTFGVQNLMEGIHVLPIAMGIFGIGEVLLNLEETGTRVIYSEHIKNILPTLKDWKESIAAILRGSVIGFLLGVIPGGGGVLASYVAYGIEKKVSKEPEKFGQGVIQGVACPESANNAAASSCFVPLMTLGIPTNVTTSILLGGLLIHGLTPGPILLRENPDFFWGIVTSMYIGNAMLLVLNLPLIRLWVQVLRTPPRFLLPMIVLFCAIGVYSVNNSVFDLGLMLFFGIFGYVARKRDYEPPPLMLAYVLGPMIENALRQSLIMSEGSPVIFFARPISAVAMALAVLLFALQILPSLKKKRVAIALARQD